MIDHTNTDAIVCPECGEAYALHDVEHANVVTCSTCGCAFGWEAEARFSTWRVEEKTG